MQEQYSVRKNICITPSTAKAVNDFRFENKISSESEVYRRIIALGVEALRFEGKEAANG